jgi:hypothetical protein
VREVETDGTTQLPVLLKIKVVFDGALYGRELCTGRAGTFRVIDVSDAVAIAGRSRFGPTVISSALAIHHGAKVCGGVAESIPRNADHRPFTVRLANGDLESVDAEFVVGRWIEA